MTQPDALQVRVGGRSIASVATLDFTPSQIAELAECHPNLVAVKESSGDVRRAPRSGARAGAGVG